MSVPLTSNLEDYLEAIFFLLQKGSEAHAADIAQRLSVTRASVTGALRSLSEKELIVYTPYHAVTLTEAGATIAARIADRHQVLEHFFRGTLGVANVEAEEAACNMEHSTTPEAMDRFVRFIRFLDTCDLGSLGWQAEIGAKPVKKDRLTAI